MRKPAVVLGTLTAVLLSASSVSAQQAVKIGLILTLSGQFADAGIQLENGIKTYMKLHGDTVERQ